MNYCRTIVNFFSKLNDWKSEDKLQNVGVQNEVLPVAIFQLFSNDMSLKSATQQAMSNEPTARTKITK